jgi:ribosomal protein L37AE/L43A
MKICPKCEGIIHFNYYFGVYRCKKCQWEDTTYRDERIKFRSNQRNNFDSVFKTITR